MNTNETYVMSTLSEASYADFTTALQPDGSFSASLVEDALINDSDFSKTQAAAFVTQWRVVNHQPNTLSGFSATLFERLDADQQGTGEYTLAIRGTELGDLRDWAVDVLLAASRGVPQFDALQDYYESLLTRGVLAAGQSFEVSGVE